MPLHDYHCPCGFNFEMYVKWDEYEIACPKCKKRLAKRVYKGFRGMTHDAPDWMKDTLEVVDKDGGPHCQEFIRHPNRSNYKRWMDKEGLRPMEPGEPMKRKKRDTSGLRKKVHENFRKRNTIEVRS